MILLDSSVLIDLLRKKNKKEAFFNQIIQIDDDLAVSIITHYEILCGSNNLQDSFWKSLFENISILSFDISCSSEAVKIYKDLKKANKIVDIADILIAATAISHNVSLATINFEHFSRIKGLKLFKNINN